MNPYRQPNAGNPRTAVRAEMPRVKVTESGVATLRLYDVIDGWGGDWGVSAREFAAAVDSLPDNVTEIRLLINSPGGEVFEGMAIMNALRAHPAKVTAVVEGIAASSASFIAASADELVMMRNSELYIHNAWGIVMGDAADLRSQADELEQYFDRNMASIYAEKSGKPVEYWLDEMHKDRFLTAEQAVEEGLANRIEGTGDAGAAKARFDLSVFDHSRHSALAAKAALQTPVSSEPGEPNPKEDRVSDTYQAAGIRERLGLTDADATDEQVHAALDALRARAEVTAPPVIPAGATLIDSAILAELQAAAATIADVRAEQDAARRDAVIATAVSEGRIAPANAATWRENLDANEAGTTALLGTFAKNTIPVTEIGRAENNDDPDEASYLALFPDEKVS